MSHQSELIAEDIERYLKEHEEKELLRFITCGSVDDGKSTLIGRLLYDSKMIFEDQLASIKNESKKSGSTEEELDLALLVDGLQSEREQGITIDVAYRYFSTEKRKFIIADTPGHEQYTRNMATGASTADLAIILIDARYGVQTQTKRHSFIVNLLGIKHIIVAINKMDLVDYDQAVYERICADYTAFSMELGSCDRHFVPLSALNGENVVTKSELMPWYKGDPLMEILESVEIIQDRDYTNFRLPVQYVNRPNLDFRGFAGTIASGTVAVDDTVVALPSGKRSTVKEIVTYDGDLKEAYAEMAVTLTLNDEIDIGRGDMLVKENSIPMMADSLDVHLVWMGEEPLQTEKNYYIKCATAMTNGVIEKIYFKKNINTLDEEPATTLALNEIGYAKLSLNKSIVFDPYENNRQTGSFIVIDRITNSTVAAGMIVQASEEQRTPSSSEHSNFEIEFNDLVRRHFPHWEAKAIF